MGLFLNMQETFFLHLEDLKDDRDEAHARRLQLGSIKLRFRALALRILVYAACALAVAEFGYRHEYFTTTLLLTAAWLLCWHAAVPWPSVVAAACTFPLVEVLTVNAADRTWRYRISATNSSNFALTLGVPAYLPGFWAVATVAMLDMFRVGARVLFVLHETLPPK